MLGQHAVVFIIEVVLNLQVAGLIAALLFQQAALCIVIGGQGIHHAAVSIVVGALDLAVLGHIHVGGLQNAGVVIKHAGNAVDHNGALCHSAGDEVKVISTLRVGIPALDHMAVGIIADPLAAVGVLIDILADSHCAIIDGIQPVPGIGSGVIDFLAAASGALALAAFVPELVAVDVDPLLIQANACGGIKCAGNAVYRTHPLYHSTGHEIEVVSTLLVGIPALDHMAVGIVTHPLAAVGVLIDVLIGGHSTALNSIQPVPGIALGVIDFLAAASGALAHAVFVPIPGAAGVFLIPAVLRRCIIGSGVLFHVVLCRFSVNFRFLGGCGFRGSSFHHCNACSGFSLRVRLLCKNGQCHSGHHCQRQQECGDFFLLHVPFVPPYKWAYPGIFRLHPAACSAARCFFNQMRPGRKIDHKPRFHLLYHTPKNSTTFSPFSNCKNSGRVFGFFTRFIIF